MTSAIYGVRLVRKLSGERLARLIALLLIGIGALLLWKPHFRSSTYLSCQSAPPLIS